MSAVFASLGRFQTRFGQLYGTQFHIENATTQELLAADYVGDKLLVLWQTMTRLWMFHTDKSMMRYAALGATKEHIPVCQ